jgi:hypothetical protein
MTSSELLSAAVEVLKAFADQSVLNGAEERAYDAALAYVTRALGGI